MLPCLGHGMEETTQTELPNVYAPIHFYPSLVIKRASSCIHFISICPKSIVDGWLFG